MRKTYLFMMVSLDGFFEGPDHDLYKLALPLQHQRSLPLPLRYLPVATQ